MFDRHHAVDCQQLATFGIVVNQRLCHRTIARQALRQHLRGVIGAHFLAASARLGGTGFYPLQQRALVDAKLYHGVEPHAFFLQEFIQGLGLRHRARKAVEDKSLRRVRLIQAVRDESDHDIVRHQTAAGHDALRPDAHRRLRCHSRTQHFAGRELDDAITLNQTLGLCSHARPRRPEKYQSHPVRPRLGERSAAHPDV